MERVRDFKQFQVGGGKECVHGGRRLSPALAAKGHTGAAGATAMGENDEERGGCGGSYPTPVAEGEEGGDGCVR